MGSVGMDLCFCGYSAICVCIYVYVSMVILRFCAVSALLSTFLIHQFAVWRGSRKDLGSAPTP